MQLARKNKEPAAAAAAAAATPGRGAGGYYGGGDGLGSPSVRPSRAADVALVLRGLTRLMLCLRSRGGDTA